jgi:hypothetical protein
MKWLRRNLGSVQCWLVVDFWPGYQPRSSSRYCITYLPDLGIVNTLAWSMNLPGQVSEILIPKHTLFPGYYFHKKVIPYLYILRGTTKLYPSRLFISFSSIFHLNHFIHLGILILKTLHWFHSHSRAPSWLSTTLGLLVNKDRSSQGC